MPTMVCQTACSPAMSTSQVAIHRKEVSCAPSWKRCFPLSSRSLFLAIRLSEIGWNASRSTHSPAPSPTTCGPINTISSRIKSSVAYIPSHGQRMDRNRISMGLSRTSDAAPQTSIRAGRNSLQACGWHRLTTVWSLQLMRLAHFTRSIARTEVRIRQETEYPFRGAVRIAIDPSAPVRFPLRLRIPGWASETVIRINGETEPAPEPATFARIERTWKTGDVVEVHFPLVPQVTKGYRDSISIARGPLVFSYPIGESWVKLRDRGMTADWQVFPATQWNYALTSDSRAIQQQDVPIGKFPFTLKNAPVRLQVKARKLIGWRSLDGVAAEPAEGPVHSAERDETITLVPYAAAKLRITAFPQLSDESL